ncbi:putative flippase GtrA [Catenuloplanes nepalensis]|uniref:Flippase GtrA n=1 Tax=Catenuloplanes nepalensis TaxID=587533 RepID=A0ABT9MKD4_9ACTN|nr:GtrA family protein [Catenuloplanes nepalensis]MDP9791511.1 putative flippase GtrA [Catenuloplanes nepalensis]
MTCTAHATGRRRRLLRPLLNDRRAHYVLAGGLGAVVYYGLFSAGWLILHRHYLLLAVLANAATAVLTYPVYRRIFGGTGSRVAGLARFYLVSLGSLACSLGGLPLLVESAGLPVLPAQALIIVVAPLLTYHLHRGWSFR